VNETSDSPDPTPGHGSFGDAPGHGSFGDAPGGGSGGSGSFGNAPKKTGSSVTLPIIGGIIAIIAVIAAVVGIAMK
jgi:hypothetical protein